MSRRKTSCMVCNTKDWSLTYFNFPSCPELRAKWISNLNLKLDKKKKKIVTTSSRVCERHFAKDQFCSARRTRLKPKAVPRLKEAVRTKEVKQKETIRRPTNRDNGIVDLAGHCAFCLEALTSVNCRSELGFNEAWTPASLEHLWPYLLRGDLGGSAINFAASLKFAEKMTNDGNCSFSKIPPMCSPCRSKVETLNNLHEELEEIMRKLAEQTDRVNGAANEVRKSIQESSKLRRNRVQASLTVSNLHSNYIFGTIKFLDYLSGPPNAPLPNAVNPIPVIQNPVTFIPTISTPVVGQNQKLFVINTTAYLGQCSTSTTSQVQESPTVHFSSDLKSTPAPTVSQSASKKPAATIPQNVVALTKVTPKTPENSGNGLLQKRDSSYFNQSRRLKVSGMDASASDSRVNNYDNASSSDDEELIDAPIVLPTPYHQVFKKEEIDQDDYGSVESYDGDPLA